MSRQGERWAEIGRYYDFFNVFVSTGDDRASNRSRDAFSGLVVNFACGNPLPPSAAGAIMTRG
jgi:hypothetical protein